MTLEKTPPTLYEWAGGDEAFKRLTSTFYGKVLEDPLLEPLFGTMAQEHPERVAWCLSEVFGGPKTYTEQRGGHRHLIQQHLHRHLSEQQRARWVSLLLETADEIGLPSDPEFRAAFVSYIEWGSRIALSVSQSDGEITEDLDPMPQWNWIVKPFQD
ncbi:group II truncated hemoglobin [Tengunoibacter tsumagoiensis]|uniref:Globin n=1 Tax=Tengunoibacter tsumagoiensis TaxID=2014871 RepID=A0A402AA81_9CHLR|nr:group II truncated hemoglobin [Tengunoibacter tsumagoiensis]GCE15865.1 globin [Tengunoibacter tsumagoiensis]